MFRDRHDAALGLGEHLGHYRGKRPLVLGIPRGGVVVGSVLARELQGDFDIVLTRKLRTPGRPELAMGSVDESGNVCLNDDIVGILDIGPEMIEEERQRQVRELESRSESYRRVYPKIPLAGRIVIITDDGIATGATMKAAVSVAKTARPARLVVALPVGAPDSVAEIEREVDEMVCSLRPVNFEAVGQFYESFQQITDEEVEKLLRDLADTRSRDSAEE
jgi:predicted phosphoribosyltransferase